MVNATVTWPAIPLVSISAKKDQKIFEWELLAFIYTSSSKGEYLTIDKISLPNWHGKNWLSCIKYINLHSQFSDPQVWGIGGSLYG